MGFLRRYNFWIMAGIVAVAVVLGILNNFRVHEEQRVPLWGAREQEADNGIF